MDQRPGAVVGEHAVGHVQKEGVELVALVLHRLERVVKHLCHVVKRRGEDADLVGGVDGQHLVKVAARDALGPLGQLLDGVNHRLGEQKAQKERDEKPHKQRL